MQAYVLVNVAGQRPAGIAQELLRLEDVHNIHVDYGDCDLIVNVKTDNLLKLREFVLSKILGTRGVKRVSTLIVAD